MLPIERHTLETTWLHATVGRIDRDTRTVLETRRKKKTNDLAFSVNDSHERVVHVTLRIDRLERILFFSSPRNTADSIVIASHRSVYFPSPSQKMYKMYLKVTKMLLVTRFRERKVNNYKRLLFWRMRSFIFSEKNMRISGIIHREMHEREFDTRK